MSATTVSELKLKELLEAGAHFGHQTQKWNPKMRKYVYGEKNGIYIIDLGKTIPLAKKAYEFLKQTAAEGRPILFVGTKRQAAETVKKMAESCGAFHVTFRWPGGMLTNFKTITLSVDKLRKVEKMKETGDFDLLTKKERSKIDKEVTKLERSLGGIKNMRKLPGALFVIDPNNERIAIAEAQKLKIPVVAITDTNCDPTGIDYVVPGNDDAIKSVTMFLSYFVNSIVEGGVKAKGAKGENQERDVLLESEILAKFENDIDLKVDDEVVEELEEVDSVVTEEEDL